jgi:hypothetical protein
MEESNLRDPPEFGLALILIGAFVLKTPKTKL